MTWYDWLIVALPMAIVAGFGIYAQRYVLSVSDFLTGGRVAGRYVVAIASGEATMGLIGVVATFEMYYATGFAIGFWNGFAAPVTMLIALTGFAVYRYRETRAMTIAQFFEVRYSKAFRIFSGLLAWSSGVINFAIFPVVGGRFIVYYAGLPPTFHIFSLEISTLAVVMAVSLAISILIVCFGGQLTTMVIDCVAGIFTYALFVIVALAVYLTFSWDQMRESLSARPPGESMVVPFDTFKLSEFNAFFVIVGIISMVYNVLSWQGTQGYNAAAYSPHEQKMAKILSNWRTSMLSLLMIVMSVAAFTYLHHPAFAAGAANVEAELASKIQFGSEVTTQTIRDQLRVPIAISHFLPKGVVGAFFAIMIFLMISTNSSYLHSWGSIFVQDVVLPLRKKAFTQSQQLFLLRLSICAVAFFALCFSLCFNQVTYILMFTALTGAVYLGGAGAVILGGLYWKRGTTAGAWTAMISGAFLAIAGFIATQCWADPIYPYLKLHWPALLSWLSDALNRVGEILPFVHWQVTPERFPISGQEIYFLTMLFATLAYVGVSLATCRAPYNLEKMLHRGKYKRPDDFASDPGNTSGRNLKRFLFGYDASYSLGDKILSISMFVYSTVIFSAFLGVILWNWLIQKLSFDAWASYFWFTTVGLALVIGLVTVVWFTIGGIVDLRQMFKRLATLERNLFDDGRVLGHTNAEDIGFAPETIEQSLHTEVNDPKKLINNLRETSYPISAKKPNS